MTFSKLGTDTDTGQFVYIPQPSRRKGLYIIGATGAGKSGLIENLILQDIDQGLGVGLLDPHGDLTNAILAKMTRRLDDVILLDITDEDYPFGLNLFECPNPRSSKEVQKIVDLVMHIFEKLYDVSRQTPRMAQFLRNCTYTLVANPGYTMAEIPLLLQDDQCRKKLVAQVTDPQVRLFWKTYDALKPSEQQDRAESTLNKMDEFLQPLTRNIVGQAKTTIDLLDVMDKCKILLVKLSAQLDQVTSLVGSLIIALLLNAAYSRASLPVHKRKQFNIYADEFQNFATEDFAKILTEARKFGVATTIAHQTRYQPGMTDGIRAVTLQAANLVVFRVTSPDANDLAGSFDCSPPPPGIIGQQPLETPVQDVVGHIKNRGGHPDPTVTQFVLQFQQTIVKQYREYQVLNFRIYPDDPVKVSEQMLSFLNDLLYEANVNKNPYTPLSFDTIKSFAQYLGFPTCFSFFYEMHTTSSGQMYVTANLNIVDVTGYQALLSILDASDPTQPAIANAWDILTEGVRDYYIKRFQLPLVQLNQYLILEGMSPPWSSYDPRQTLSTSTILPFNWQQTLAAKFQHIKGMHEFRHFDYPFISIHPLEWFSVDWQRLEHLQWFCSSGATHYKSATWQPAAGQESLWYSMYELFQTIAPFVTHEIQSFQQFLIDLRGVMEILATPGGEIKESSGISTPLYDKPRQFADVKNDIANQLSGQPDYTARVKIGGKVPQNPGKTCQSCGYQGQPGAIYCGVCGIELVALNEYTITTLAPGQSVGKKVFDFRIASIQARNRDPQYGGYCRARQDVEAEILQRQTGCSGLPPIQPRHARQVQVQGTCQTCGASNPPGSKFCNQCGGKL